MNDERIETAIKRIEVALARISVVADNAEIGNAVPAGLVARHETFRETVAISLKELDELIEGLDP